MGGGGFMQHASDTNRKDRAQKAARREKFNGNQGEKNTLNENQSTILDFSLLSEAQIAAERKRIQLVFNKRRKKNRLVFVGVLFLIVLGIVCMYYFVGV